MSFVLIDAIGLVWPQRGEKTSIGLIKSMCQISVHRGYFLSYYISYLNIQLLSWDDRIG